MNKILLFFQMSQKDEIQTLAPIIRANKNFVYKGKKFPIDFSLIKKNSNYFYSKRFQYKLIHDIELEEQPIEISDDSLRNFISSCQNESFHINDSNIYQLHQLSIKYDVPYLISLTNLLMAFSPIISFVTKNLMSSLMGLRNA